jgi:hypothetical protein
LGDVGCASTLPINLGVGRVGGTDTIPINWVMLGAPALFQLIWVLGVPGLIILFKDSVWTHLIKILVLGVKKKLKKKKKLKN